MRRYKIRTILIGFVLLTIFVILAIYANTEEEWIIDTKVYEAISNLHGERMTHFFKTITLLGNGKFIVISCIIFLWIKQTRVKIGVPVSLSVIIVTLLNLLLKELFERQRPNLEQLVYEDSFSFPSGHAMVTATLFTFLIYASYRYIANKRVKAVVMGILTIIMLLVGISRIYLRVHYFSDILAGWTLGGMVTLITIYSIHKVEEKKQKRITS